MHERVIDKEIVEEQRIPLSFLGAPRENITTCPVDGFRDAIVIENLLSAEECEEIIKRTEAVGFTFWDPSENAKSEFRSAYTIDSNHQGLADTLWARVRDICVAELDITEDNERHELDLEGTWRAYGVHPILLFGRYRNGGHFGPHSDGSVEQDFNHRTLYTLLIYLKDTFDGGETLFLDADMRDAPLVPDAAGRLHADKKFVRASVEPRVGRAVIFYKTEMHEACSVGPEDEKYIIRSDILYRRDPEILTAPEDIEAYALWREAQRVAESGDPNAAMPLFRRCFKLSPGFAAVMRQ